MSNRFDAVLFDWSGTLAVDPSRFDRVRHALQRIGRPSEASDVMTIVDRLEEAATLPDVREALHGQDCSSRRHLDGHMLFFNRAGLDDEIAAALYAFDADPANRPLYSDTRDVLAALSDRGVLVSIVSDIHLDLRHHLGQQGVAQFVHEYVLSCELGVEKPDPAIFCAALDRLGVRAERAMMVGDRASHDGGAAGVGINTLILSYPPPGPGPRGLDVVVDMLGRRATSTN